MQDTNSTNGTYLNNKLLYPRVWTELTEHDILRFGDLVFEVSFDTAWSPPIAFYKKN
ncbi:MAG: FHA domain-containing protein, partial [Chitinophagia bacterium]|nr:FHA domain-containing protein [Chitinophagia bacterium]